jgi:hypothetical protein
LNDTESQIGPALIWVKTIWKEQCRMKTSRAKSGCEDRAPTRNTAETVGFDRVPLATARRFQTAETVGTQNKAPEETDTSLFWGFVAFAFFTDTRRWKYPSGTFSSLCLASTMITLRNSADKYNTC